MCQLNGIEYWGIGALNTPKIFGVNEAEDFNKTLINGQIKYTKISNDRNYN